MSTRTATLATAATVATTSTPPPRPLSELASLVSELAARPQDWIDRVRLRVGERWYERLERSENHEVCAISWLPGQATGYDLSLIVVCSEGYTSSLAAASLQELGLSRATDIIGGFHAWCSAGLPTTTA